MLAALVGEPAQAVVRALMLGAILIVVGTALFSLRIAPLFDGEPLRGAEVRRHALRTLRLAALVLTITLVGRLVQQAAAFADTPSQWPTMVPTVLAHTMWGVGLHVQAAAIAAVLLASPTALRAPSAQPWSLGVAALLLAASPALAGHAIGAPRLTVVAVVMDAVHVAAAGAWLGTLFVIAVAAIPSLGRGSAPLALSVFDRFSAIALTSAVVVALTGVFASWLHLESLRDLWTSGYGRTLLVKLATLGGVAAVGAYNWRIVTPRLRATGDLDLLRRSALIELVFAVTLVAVTAVLVATPLPGEM